MMVCSQSLISWWPDSNGSKIIIILSVVNTIANVDLLWFMINSV